MAGEPLFVKNLETVQGDERDAIIVSTTFGRPRGSKVVRQNFGPISQQGGWRRLNVLFTRAKKSITVVTSLKPEDIVVDGSTPEGTKALQRYLKYIQTGSLQFDSPTGLEPESDFERSVIALLTRRGFEVTPQLGVSGYRIDIAVKDPKRNGSYLAAIECDGASYHSARSVRDRDRIRQEILESLGWRGRIWRIWSTDWFRDPRKETENLLNFLDNLGSTWDPSNPGGKAWVEEGVSDVNSIALISDAVKSANSKPSKKKTKIKKVVLNETEDAEEEGESSEEDIFEAIDKYEYEAEIEVGDTVFYFDTENPNHDVLKRRIVKGKSDARIGVINEFHHLAQAFLGAVVGDIISVTSDAGLHVFRITAIEKG